MTRSASSSVSRSQGARGTAVLLLDTNILLRSARPGFRWEGEADRLVGGFRAQVPSIVMAELDRLISRGVVGSRAAREIARRFPTAHGAGRGDDAILALAVRRKATVLTADRALAGRLTEAGIDVLIPRDRNRLELRRGDRTVAGLAPPRATVKKRAPLRTST